VWLWYSSRNAQISVRLHTQCQQLTVIEVTRNKNRVVFSFGNLFMLFCFRIAKNRIALTHSLAVISVSTVAATALLCY